MATVHLPSKNILAPYLSGYNSEGNPAPAMLPDALTVKLPGTGTNVNHIILRPTTTAISTDTECYAKTGASAATVDSGMTATVSRPLGGSGTATLVNLRAIEFLLVADPVTTAEIEAGSTASRTGAVRVSVLSAASGGDTVFATDLVVAAAGESERASLSRRLAVELGATTTLVVTGYQWSPKVKLHILTVAQS